MAASRPGLPVPGTQPGTLPKRVCDNGRSPNPSFPRKRESSHFPHEKKVGMTVKILFTHTL